MPAIPSLNIAVAGLHPVHICLAGGGGSYQASEHIMFQSYVLYILKTAEGKGEKDCKGSEKNDS